MSESAEHADRDSSEKPFLDHLDDLRSTIIHCGLWLVGGMAIAWPFAPGILRLLKRPLAAAGQDPDSLLQVFHVTGGFTVAMSVIFWTGLLLATPGILASISHFVYPGLLQRERRTVTCALLFAAVMFVAGVSMGYFLTIHVAIRMLFKVTHWIGTDVDVLLLSAYVGFVLKLLLAFGLAFELPVVLLALGRMGLVGSNILRTKRRHAIIGLAVMAMLLTPQDWFSMVLMAIPLVLLYEACIWIIWFWEKKASDAYASRHDGPE
jgi:sec-independent protein translocase protein TatC